jgi:hypothetical protein
MTRRRVPIGSTAHAKRAADTIQISLQAKIRHAFEQTANAEGNIYNFTPAAQDDKANTYWSLHTERAWRLFNVAYLLGMGEQSNRET